MNSMRGEEVRCQGTESWTIGRPPDTSTKVEANAFVDELSQ